jgi:hypothetical protein
MRNEYPVSLRQSSHGGELRYLNTTFLLHTAGELIYDEFGLLCVLAEKIRNKAFEKEVSSPSSPQNGFDDL